MAANGNEPSAACPAKHEPMIRCIFLEFRVHASPVRCALSEHTACIDAMKDAVAHRIAAVMGASRAIRQRKIATVWSGYGEVVRYRLDGSEVPSVVVKHIVAADGMGRSHDRKVRSYEVEQTWYRDWASGCDDACRVPHCFVMERQSDGWLLLFEDLDVAGFSSRADVVSGRRFEVCLRWLAAFHGRFMNQRPRGLWKTGAYWHLKTRPNELRSMKPGPLRSAAAKIEERLGACRFQTFVHGDAKPANFCFSRDGRRAAAVDFQYVGGGCGMKDVAYFLAAEDNKTVGRGLDVYFRELRKVLGTKAGGEVEREWRPLYAWAWADFHRFLAGWAPNWRCLPHELAFTEKVLSQV